MRARWTSSSLFSRIFLLNAAVLLGAGAALVLTPATVSSPVQARQAAVLAAGLVALLSVDVVLLRRTLRPLSRLVDGMRDADLLTPGRRVAQDGPGRELVAVSRAFNEMLDRLERERAASATAGFEASEEERRRLARELHDQVGQDLTALLMVLDRLHRGADPAIAAELTGARELTREILDSVRTIVFELRPDPLEELGLLGALDSLSERSAAGSGIPVSTDLPPALPPLTGAAEVAIYRIAQEALSNAVRHAGARRISVALRAGAADRLLVLSVRDDGNGRPPGPDAGVGLRGMRERALTLGARLDLLQTPGAGTEVRLSLPLTEADA